MTSEKRPSVYSDRGSFGSAEELDEYGVWIKCEPQDLSLTDSDDLETAGLSSIDFEDSASDTGKIKGFDPSELGEIELLDNNFNIESDDILPNVAALAAEESIDANFDEFPVADGDTDVVSPVSADDFEVPTVETIETASRMKESDISNQLLQKIANELSSIRNELSEMKKEFAIVRASVPAGEAKEDDQHGGFFSEEEDETIALTGDELNNILNTADFTEESGTNETLDESPVDAASIDGSSPDEGSSDDKDSEDELIQIDLDSLGIDLNPDIPAEEAIPAVEDLPIEDKDDELEKLRTEGAIPINPAPENISYLEESEIADFEDDVTESVTDNMADDGIGIDSFDVLTALDDDAEVEEPSMVETADDVLDNMDDISIETQADDGNDIVLPMPENSLDIDMLTDDSLDISIPEDDFAALPDAVESISAPENSLDIDILTDDSLDISIPEDDFAALPDDSLSMPEDDFAALPEADASLPILEDDFAALSDDGFDVDMIADDSLDISMPEDDFATPTMEDDSLSIPQDDFAAPLEADAGDDGLSALENSLDIDMLTDDSLDMSIPEDDFAALPEAEDGDGGLQMPEDGLVMDMLTDNSDLPMPDDDFVMPAMEDVGLPMPEDDFTALPEADDSLDSSLSMPDDDFATPAMEDDNYPMPDDDFAMPAMEDDGLPMLEDDFTAPTKKDDGLATPKDSVENVIPEELEAEIEENQVPFDDDLRDDLAVQEMSSLLGTTAKDRSEKRVKTSVIRDFSSAPDAANKKKSHETDFGISPTLKKELKTVLSYMDRLLDSLPEEKIAEFAKSEYFDSYKKLFKELGLV
jgi:hypothetical protein